MLFYSLTDIILLIPISGNKHIRKIKMDQYLVIEGNVDYNIDTFSETQDILNNVEFTGWAFVQTTKNNNDKKIRLVFKSEKNSYEVDAEIFNILGLQGHFPEKKIYGNNQGFTTKFSPIQMENGIYKLYFYCFENEEAVGFIDSKIVFEKKYRSFLLSDTK